MYEVAICDDILPICEEVRRLVSEQLLKRDIDVRIHTYTSGQALMSAEIVFDILFLDIDLKGENGLEIAASYPNKNETRIIFLTSHVEEMPNGYKVKAFRFLTKPINQEYFEEALFSAISDMKQDNRFIVTDMDGEYIIRASEIYYLESKQRSTDIRTKEKFARCGLSIKEMKQELDAVRFYSPHRSYIVNMSYIQSFGKDIVVMKNGEKISVSRLKMKQFKEKFYEYLRSTSNGF